MNAKVKKNINKDNKQKGQKEPAPPTSDRKALPEISLNTIGEYYHRKLYENAPAVEYLEKRGLTDPAIYGRFKIGFVDGSLHKLLEEDQKTELQESGILNENGKEHFLNCLTVPIKDDLGNIAGFYGRTIKANAKTKDLYIKGEHKGIFNLKASKVYKEIILTKSIIDALSLIKLDFENVQALYGINGFTDEHLKVLKDDRVKTVIIGFEEAGELKEKLLSERFAVKIIIPPKCKDWNEYITGEPNAEQIKELIEEAVTSKPEMDNSDFHVEIDYMKYLFTIDGIKYRLLGVKDLFISSLRVNVKAEYEGESDFDNLDLYSSRSRESYSNALSEKLGIESRRIEKDLRRILEYLEEERDKRLSPVDEDKEYALTKEEKALGVEFLKSPDLFDQVVKDMDTIGYVGEILNKQLMYIAASSRKLDDPISVLVVSESASGKSMLVDTVKKLIPAEDVISVTSLSDQALNYVGDLSHKFMTLGEALHGDIVDLQLREMLSSKELSRMVTMKDSKSGVRESKIIRTKAIVSCVMSTTDYNINPENASRSFIIDTDESREQTQRIHEAQRAKYTLERYKEMTSVIPGIIKKHHSAQRLLKKIVIVNRFAYYLRFPDKLMRTRRDHDRFLDLIAGVCFIRQYQKETKNNEGIPYIECDLDDYKIAYTIMVNGVLSATMLDLPKGAISLYEDIREMVREMAKERKIETREVTFIQKEVRAHTGLGGELIKKHIRTLVDYEYIQVTNGKNRGTRRSYRIRSDEPIDRVDFDMIPAPVEMGEMIKKELPN